MVDKNLQDFELAALDEWVELAKLVNEEASKNETKNDQYMLSNKCNQCDYTSSCASNLRRHLKTHSREKSNKCNQCNYVSSYESHLRTRLKTHNGEKPNKCSQCDYASIEKGDLRKHLKTHIGQKQMLSV